jgi:hypothetical protein
VDVSLLGALGGVVVGAGAAAPLEQLVSNASTATPLATTLAAVRRSERTAA